MLFRSARRVLGLGLMALDEDGNFRPEEPLSRGAFARVLERAILEKTDNPRLGTLFAADVRRGGAVWKWLEPHAGAAFDQAYVLRLLGGLHRMALAGESAQLAARFPSTGGDGDADATYQIVESLLAAPPPALVDKIGRAHV